MLVSRVYCLSSTRVQGPTDGHSKTAYIHLSVTTIR